MRTSFFLLIALLVGILFEGCGGSSQHSPGTTSTPAPAGATPTPNPGMTPTPTPTPTPSPTPSPGGPTPTPAPAGPDSYLAQIFLTVGKNPVSTGQITVDAAANNGAGNLQLTNVGANLSLILQLCPYPQAFANCINVTSFATDASGNANVNFQFPQKGAFAGEFQIVGMNGNQFAAAGAGGTGLNFRAAMLPAGSITGGIAQTTGMAPGIGSVTVTNTTAHVTLTGTTPNATFTAAICGIFPQTPCDPLANVTTDMNGNANMDVGTVQTAGSNIFRLSDAAGVEFVSGFRVQ